MRAALARRRARPHGERMYPIPDEIVLAVVRERTPAPAPPFPQQGPHRRGARVRTRRSAAPPRPSAPITLAMDYGLLAPYLTAPPWSRHPS
jgi:hypothetical protein